MNDAGPRLLCRDVLFLTLHSLAFGELCRLKENSMAEQVIGVDSVKMVVRFQPVRLGGQYCGEEAWLGWANEHFVALLVRISGRGLPRTRHGWFLEAGFGPCRGEGMFFPSLSAAEDWIRDKIPAGWPGTTTGKQAPKQERVGRKPETIF
jgi:hypothetical protein